MTTTPNPTRTALSPDDRPNPLPWSDDHTDLVIGDRFNLVASARTEQTALCLDDREWTYGQLASAARRVSDRLHRIQPTGRVVLYLGNSFHHFAAALGAWQAGWVTVPMDPRYPSTRNAQILRDAEPDLILTCPEHRDALGPTGDLAVEDRPIDRYEAAQDRDGDPHGPTVRPETPAVILYTSGSTGEPKGVLHTHASVTHMVKRRSHLSLTHSDDAFTLFYSASVMGGLAGFLSGLLTGASLHPRDIRNDGITDMGAWLRRHRITCCHSVTSLFRAFTRQIEPGQSFPDLRLVILGGEQAYPADIELGRKVYGPAVEFSCGLGSTEINVARQIPVPPGSALPRGRMPFGYAVEGIDAIILDRNRNLVGQGVTGEIAFRSRYLSAGYWKQPEQTQERFIPDPEGSDLTVYLTGDLGSIDASGCLGGAGRSDHQVKIRGFRVEPGEVNSHLMAQPGISESCTIPIKAGSGTLSLAAFYVTETGKVVTTSSLRRALAEALPDYMVPDHLVELDTFPRTPNGKIDPGALRLPKAVSVPERSRPKTPSEKRLSDLWASVLERDSVPVDTSFFELGGTSLSAITLLARIEKKMHRQLPVSILLEHSTIHDLAGFMDRKATRSGRSSLVPVRPQGAGTPIYLIGGMTGEVFFCRRLLAHLNTSCPVYALEPDTLSGGRTRFSRIEDVAEDYAQSILDNQPSGPVIIAGYSFGGTVAYELARNLSMRNREVNLTVIFDSVAPEKRSNQNPPETMAKTTGSGPTATANRIRSKPSKLRFFNLDYWRRDKGSWRRSYWRLKYVRLYELMIRFHLTPPISWRRCYAFWATHWMGQRYRAKPYSGEVVLFRSDAREETADKGWRDLCGDHLKMIRIPGDHGSIFREPDVQHLARELDKVLDGR